MKTKILLVFFCLLSITSFCQDSVFQLKDYKYRTKGFKSLALQFSLSGYSDNFKQGNLSQQKNRLIDLYPSYINYINVLSTDNRFHTSLISLSPSFRSHVEDNGQNKTKGNDYQASLTWNVEDRFYKKNNWFLQLANNLYAREDFVKQEDMQSLAKTTMPGVNESLLLGFGKGRLELVQDAQMALFILNDLKDQGLIATLPSAELVNEFAQLITEVNNRRVFDSRRKRVYELKQIDNFLREKGIASINDIRHFTIINDNWAFAFNPYRLSGSIWQFDLKSSVEIGKSKQTVTQSNSKTISENKSTLYGTGPSASYENHKPKSLKWQRNFGSSLSYRIGKSEINNSYSYTGGSFGDSTKSNEYLTEFNAFYGFGFFPNNRTKLNATLGAYAANAKYKSGSLNKSFSLHPSFNFSTDYFLSYKTRLTANVYMLYSYDHIRQTAIPFNTANSFHAGFSIGLSHYFL